MNCMSTETTSRDQEVDRGGLCKHVVSIPYFVSISKSSSVLADLKGYIHSLIRAFSKGGYQGAPPLYSLFCDNNFLLE